jgi:hypothetical protein
MQKPWLGGQGVISKRKCHQQLNGLSTLPLATFSRVVVDIEQNTQQRPQGKQADMSCRTYELDASIVDPSTGDLLTTGNASRRTR